MARFVQTTAENVEAALQLAEELVRQGYQESEIQLIVDSEAREDETSLKYEGFNVRFVETRSNSAWAKVKEKLDLTAPSHTADDATLDAYREDLQKGRILIVVDSQRAL